jgi:hypothetical protein
MVISVTPAVPICATQIEWVTPAVEDCLSRVGVTPLLNVIEVGAPKALLQTTTTFSFVAYEKLVIDLLAASPGTPPLNAVVPSVGGGVIFTRLEVSVAENVPESETDLSMVTFRLDTSVAEKVPESLADFVACAGISRRRTR